jgi:hypothetical protein
MPTIPVVDATFYSYTESPIDLDILLTEYRTSRIDLEAAHQRTTLSQEAQRVDERYEHAAKNRFRFACVALNKDAPSVVL